MMGLKFELNTGVVLQVILSAIHLLRLYDTVTKHLPGKIRDVQWVSDIWLLTGVQLPGLVSERLTNHHGRSECWLTSHHVRLGTGEPQGYFTPWQDSIHKRKTDICRVKRTASTPPSSTVEHLMSGFRYATLLTFSSKWLNNLCRVWLY